MWLTITTKNTGYKSVSLLLKSEVLIIGRGPATDISINDRAISSTHLELSVNTDTIDFKDLNSRHGTWFHEKQVTHGTLKYGDSLDIGETTLTVTDKPMLPTLQNLGSTSFDNSERVVEIQNTKIIGNLAEISEKLKSASTPRKLMKELLNELVSVFSAHRGFILIKDGSSERLVTVASHLIDDAQDFVSLSSTVYQKAIREKKTIIVPDSSIVGNDDYALSVQLYPGPKAILCCPLISSQEVFGVVYIDMPARPDNTLPQWISQSMTTIVNMATERLAGQKTRYRLVAARERVVALQAVTFSSNKLLLGDGPDGRELKKAIKQAAVSDASVLITGETGTGKEVVANALHSASKRKNGPFIAVNCSAIPSDLIEAELFGVEKGAYTGAERRRQGRFEIASGGTLFLDETGELPLSTQIKLLRVLEERKLNRLGGNEDIPLDFRLVCATNRNLLEAIDEGVFRADLYYRVNVFHIPLKPLRERTDEIIPLATMFLNSFSRKYKKNLSGFTAEAKRLLLENTWPGNVRELRNLIERAVIVESNTEITPQSLPVIAPSSIDNEDTSSPYEPLSTNYNEAKDLFDKAFLEKSLLANDGNISAVVRETGIGRPTIYRWMKKFNFTSDD